MKFFDLHCDTITECYLKGKNLKSNDLDISLEKAECIDEWKQVFAIWMPDEKRGKDAEDYYCEVLEKFKAECKDVKGAILAVEGGSALGGKLENVEKLYRDGVKIITLTWNKENELASGCFSDEDKGLTDFGKEAVKEMAKFSIVPDVSHLSEKGFYDLCEATDFPFIASHSDVFALENHPRNLKDEQIKIIIERKGLIGLNFYNKFLGDGNSVQKLFDHAKHILLLGGTDVLCLGSDFDGCAINEEIKGIEKMPALYDAFYSYFGKTLADKIFFENADNYFRSQVFTK